MEMRLIQNKWGKITTECLFSGFYLYLQLKKLRWGRWLENETQREASLAVLSALV